MGGKGGHMLHPYEDPELTFQSLIDMFEHTAMGGLEGTIKRDGQNLVLSYSLLRDEAVAIRNDDHVFAKGMGLKGEGPKENFADYLAARSLWVVLTTPDGKKEEFTTERKWEKYLKENRTSPEALEAAGYSVEMIGRGWKSFRNGVSREKKATPRHIIVAFSKAMRDLENVAREMPKELIIKLFGEDADYFYNAEVMSPLSRNPIEYGVDTLSTHRILHHKYDEEEKELDTMGAIESGKRAEMFDRSLKNYFNEKGVPGDERNPTPVSVGAMERLAALEDDSIKKEAINKVAQMASANGLSLNDSLGQLVFVRFREAVAKALPSIGPEAEKLLIIRMFQEVYNGPGHEWEADEILREFGDVSVTEGKVPLKAIMGASADREPQVAATVKEIAGSAKRFHNHIIAPLVNIIFTFSAHALGALKDLYVLNRDAEIERTRSTVLKTIKNLETLLDPVNSSDPRADEKWEKFLAQRDKFKALEDKISEAEGFVFQWPPGSDNTYKFTGLFAPINQLLGMDPSRWAESLTYTETLLDGAGDFATRQVIKRGAKAAGIPITMGGLKSQLSGLKSSLTLKEAAAQPDVVYIPGGFKPPHWGHLNMVRQAAKRFPNASIRIVSGRAGKKPTPDGETPTGRDGITLEMAQGVWNHYFKNDPVLRGRDIEMLAITEPLVALDKEGQPRIRAKDGEVITTYSPIEKISQDVYRGEETPTVAIVYSKKDEAYGNLVKTIFKSLDEEGKLLTLAADVSSGASGANLSATAFRAAIKENDFETFKLFLPEFYNEDEQGASELFTMLGGLIEEISSGVGMVGAPRGFGRAPEVVGSEKQKNNFLSKNEGLVNEVMDYLLGISVG